MSDPYLNLLTSASWEAPRMSELSLYPLILWGAAMLMLLRLAPRGHKVDDPLNVKYWNPEVPNWSTPRMKQVTCNDKKQEMAGQGPIA